MANLVAVKDMLAEKNIEAEIREVTKNGQTFETLALEVGDKQLRPCIYNKDDIDDEQMVQMCVDSFNSEMPKFETESIMDWTVAREMVKLSVQRVASDDLVSREFLDLAIIYEVDVEGLGVAKVTKQILEVWGVSETEVYKTAYANSKFHAQTLESKMNALMGIVCEESEVSAAGMYIVTNESCFHGAGAIVKTDEIQRIAEMVGTDLYIIPSSIHELLLIGTDMILKSEVEEMVASVNDSEVAPEERLSYSVYRYDRKSRDVVLD